MAAYITSHTLTMIHYQIRVRGKVQGVFFRASTRDVALGLNLRGFVRNEPDGSVYIEAEGPESALQQLLAWCRQGPPRARVTAVTHTVAPVRGLDIFSVVT